MERTRHEWHNYSGGYDRPRILLVYPDSFDKSATRDVRLLPALPAAIDEVMQVVNLLGAHLLTGERCDIHGLLDTLAEGWDILWLVTHCDGAGWYLRDGPVSVSMTVPLVRTAGVWLTVMNTCSSLAIARHVSDELGTAVIATISSVPDRQAMITGTLFAQQLAAGHDYVTAFERAQPGATGNPYRLLEASATAEMAHERRSPPPELPDAAALARLVRSVEQMELLLYGDTRLRLPALKEMVYNLETTLSQMGEQLDRIEARQRVRNVLMWGIATGLLLLSIIVIVLISRQGIL